MDVNSEDDLKEGDDNDHSAHFLSGNFILSSRVTRTDRVILHHTREPSIIYRSFVEDQCQRGKKELFNFSHRSLRNVIERSFGVLKMKWRILLDLPSYPMRKQSQIIVACMAIHNFIRESALPDTKFDMCDQDENYFPMPEARRRRSNLHGDEDPSMNLFRDWIADGLFRRSRS